MLRSRSWYDVDMESWLLPTLWFAGWCWTINLSLNALGYATFRSKTLQSLDKPFDGTTTFFDSRRVFGDSTTWGGLVVALVLGVVGALLWPAHYLFVLALLVYAGHALGSFIKRRLGLGRGSYLPLVDHVDYLILAGIVLYALDAISGWAVLFWIFVTMIATPFITTAAFYFRVRRSPL
ncbi:MAG: hypothetical protein JWN49_395 [Parcubacteria group bacterium]|nr:hypothetical protein [Parcubacteria group bacterium]